MTQIKMYDLKRYNKCSKADVKLSWSSAYSRKTSRRERRSREAWQGTWSLSTVGRKYKSSRDVTEEMLRSKTYLPYVQQDMMTKYIQSVTSA